MGTDESPGDVSEKAVGSVGGKTPKTRPNASEECLQAFRVSGHLCNRRTVPFSFRLIMGDAGGKPGRSYPSAPGGDHCRFRRGWCEVILVGCLYHGSYFGIGRNFVLLPRLR